MKQILQELRSGKLLLQDVAAPDARPGCLLIRTTRTLISAGTERTLTSFAKASYFAKARQQPERVKQVLEKARTDGILATYEAVNSKLDQPMQLGYCNVGRVMAIGEGVAGYKIGDRVVSNCPHIEVALAPKNLCAPIPDGVSDDAAAFAVTSAIGLQGIRLIVPTLGETIVVSGLGLIGLLAVQLLKANGCKVIGFDFNADRVSRARGYGAEAYDLSGGLDPVATVLENTGGVGADGVIITAATQGNTLIHQCAQMSRKRGRIVLTGVVGLDLQRSDFYDKELSFQVSCSYGPGRYDPAYEQKGEDYPLPFVRWTEQRNFDAVLGLMREGRLDVTGLITHRVPFAQAPKAYELLDSPDSIGVLLEYDETVDEARLRTRTVAIGNAPAAPVAKGRAIGVIGAGGFTQARILPALRAAGANIKTIVSSNGTSGSIAARNFAIRQSSTDPNAVLQDPDIGAVVIATPHNSHAALVMAAMKAGRDVFVEKPLCLNEEELDEIGALRAEIVSERGAAPGIMVGFNRRFAPLAVQMRKLAQTRRGPAFGVFTCNAGAIPAEHWAQDPKVGGGRIVGEACHFIDFLGFMTGSRIVDVRAVKQQPGGRDLEDNVAISLGFADGSVGQVNYFACGSKSYPKERCEFSFDGKTLVLDNFRNLVAHGLAGSKKSWKQDKGHDAQFAAFVRAFDAGGTAANSPIPFEAIDNAMRATYGAVRSMREHAVVVL
jgi:predicted dehydrogenase/threonine dehydrogenase-like Zn-dependent dehydrogenase